MDIYHHIYHHISSLKFQFSNGLSIYKATFHFKYMIAFSPELKQISILLPFLCRLFSAQSLVGAENIIEKTVQGSTAYIPQHDDDEIQPVPRISQVGERMKNKSTRDDLKNHFCGVHCSENVSARKVIDIFLINYNLQRT